MAAVDLEIFLLPTMCQPDWADVAHGGGSRTSTCGAWLATTGPEHEWDLEEQMFPLKVGGTRMHTPTAAGAVAAEPLHPGIRLPTRRGLGRI